MASPSLPSSVTPVNPPDRQRPPPQCPNGCAETARYSEAFEEYVQGDKCASCGFQLHHERAPTRTVGNCSIYLGDCREILRTLPSKSVNCCVTSPPYYGLRDYQHADQIGLEPTPNEFVQQMVMVFREIKRVLRDDGTLWLNLGDSYASRGGTGHQGKHGQRNNHTHTQRQLLSMAGTDGLKAKDLIGIPWRVALALQADGWYLRQDIIWHKPNPMPESVTDRCTKAHEYIFLLSKSEDYYFDAKSIAEPLAESSIKRLAQPTLAKQKGSTRVPGKTNGPMKAVGPRFGGNKYGDDASQQNRTKSGNEWTEQSGKRNRRSVWTVTTKPFKGAHFATFPPDLIEPCILAGSPTGGTVIDPFFGAGTTGLVATSNARKSIGIEINPDYIELAERRLRGEKIDTGTVADPLPGADPNEPQIEMF